MPLYEVNVSVMGEYTAVVEAEDEDEAGELAFEDFDPATTYFKDGLEVCGIELAEGEEEDEQEKE